MKSKYIFIVVSLLIAFILVGCKDNNSKEDQMLIYMGGNEEFQALYIETFN